MTSENPRTLSHKSLWTLTWPLLWSVGLSLSLNFVDAFFLSRVSDEAAAAAGALLPVLAVTVMLLSVVGQAGASVAGQLLGAGREQEVPPTHVALVVFNFTLGVVMSGGFFAVHTLLPGWLGIEPHMEGYAITYLGIVGSFQFVKATQLGFTNILNSRGDTRWVLAEAIVTNVCNVGLNVLLLRGHLGLPALGVAGVAIATVASQAVGLCFTACVVRFRLGHKLPWNIPRAELARRLRPILDIGLPSAVGPISYQLSQVVINTLIISLGSAVLAARVYAMNLFLVTTLLWSIAFGIGTQIAIAHRVGEGSYDGADSLLRRSLKIAVLGNLALSILLAAAHPWLLGLLTDDPEVLRAAAPVFWIAPIVEMGRAMNIVAGGALRASGDARFTSFVSPLVMWGLGVPLCFALVRSGAGLSGVWIALAADEVARGFLNYGRWRTGRWRRLSLASRAA